ncbi:hypothetical protein R1sor_008423 [Riccia sorocarpa]|uniref:Auxin efflux carrier component n=1 Tax=Riccia sorocarpa TaxID=122646 RepID=A0ABD3HTC8_9MARC
MLSAVDFWHLVEHIIPVYAIVILAYALTKLNLIESEHVSGISRWVSFLGVPSYVFHLLAFNDPYQMSLRLVGADLISKSLALFCVCVWWRFSKSGSIEGVIGFFMLATLPNTVLVGDALLQPLYGEEVHTQVVTIIFMQSFLWYNICICLYETREVLLQENQSLPSLGNSGPDAAMSKSSPHRRIDVSSKTNAFDREPKNLESFHTDELELGSRLTSPETPVPADVLGRSPLLGSAAVLKRTISAPAGFRFSRSRSSRSLSLKRTPKGKVCDVATDFGEDESSSGFLTLEWIPDSGAAKFHRAASRHEADLVAVVSISEHGDKEMEETRDKDRHGQKEDHNLTISDGFPAVVHRKSVEIKREEIVETSKAFSRWSKLGFKIINRIKKVPLTYASIAGFVYSLLAYKYNWDMPYPVRTSIELISQTAIGMAIFLMGLAWAKSGPLISCGWKALVYGTIVRFLIGPILMIISAKAVLMNGKSFQVAVLQAAIPQGVISFVLAKEYGVDVPLFNTAVVFQLAIFVPIVICYYVILEAL